MLKRLFVVGAAITSAAAWAGFVTARTMWRTWGIVPDVVARPLAGDDLVDSAQDSDTRALEIDAPPARVWPWLLQMGYGRAGWYSYDQLDMNHPSLDHIEPALQSLAVGDTVPTHPGGGFEVRVLEPERALVLYLDRAAMLEQAKRSADAGSSTAAAPANLKATGAALERSMPGDFAASWAFVLEPIGDDRTRLVERFRIRMEPAASRPVPPFVRTMLGFGVFVMTRRQMLGIRDRVEGRPIARHEGLPTFA
ncbi:MAG TPA: hypothetical protein VET90_06670 [Candidatus Binatus sp.]|nr:hypothetical protein [Candidatus Binatus sp.]